VLFLGLFKLNFITSQWLFAFNYVRFFVMSWLSNGSTLLASDGNLGSLKSGTTTVHSVSNTDFRDPLGSTLEFGSPIATFLGFGHAESFIVKQRKFWSFAIGFISWE